jgi:hypothetical protein
MRALLSRQQMIVAIPGAGRYYAHVIKPQWLIERLAHSHEAFIADVKAQLKHVVTGPEDSRQLYTLQCSSVGRAMYIMMDWRLPGATQGGYGPQWLMCLHVGDASSITARMICVPLQQVTPVCAHATCGNIVLH